MRNNGRYTASEELIPLGVGDLMCVTDKSSRHKNINFPGHEHASLYDVNIIEGEDERYIKSLGIEVHLLSRITDIEKEDNKIKGIYLSDGKFDKA